MLRDPRVVYEEPDLYAASLLAMKNLCNPFRSYINVPILGTFVVNFIHPNGVDEYDEDQLTNDNRIMVQRGSVLQPLPGISLFDQLAEYYDVPASRLFDFDQMLTNLGPGRFVESTILSELVAHDYE